MKEAVHLEKEGKKLYINNTLINKFVEIHLQIITGMKMFFLKKVPSSV